MSEEDLAVGGVCDGDVVVVDTAVRASLPVWLPYDDDDRREVLKDRLSQAVRAVRGPTRVILKRDGEKMVSCRLILLGEDVESIHGPLATSWPFRRLAARLTFRRLVSTAIDVTACG